MYMKGVSKICCLLLELLLLATLSIVALYLPKLWQPTTQSGFFCDDTTLRYPYHKNTVTNNMLYCIGLYFPLSVIVSIELLSYFCRKSSLSMLELLWRLYRLLSTFLLGFACERIFKNVGKITLHRLRPHFMAVCQPLLSDGSTCAHHPREYIESYTCQAVNSTPEMLRSIHLSFPSGHSSMTFYGMAFLALYMQHYCTGRGIARLLIPVLQLLFLLVAWFVALSRVLDHMHHGTDVLAGSMLGVMIAVFVYAMRQNYQGKNMGSWADRGGEAMQSSGFTSIPSQILGEAQV